MSAPRAGCILPPKEIPWYLLLLEIAWIAGLLNANRRKNLLKNFQGSNRESNTEPKILWRIVSSDCAVHPPREGAYLAVISEQT